MSLLPPAPPTPPSPKWKSFWRWVGWVAGGVVILASVGVASMGQPNKIWFAALVGVAGLLSLISKIKLEWIDEREKASKSRQEEADKEEHRKAVEEARAGTTTIVRRVVGRILESLKSELYELFDGAAIGRKYNVRVTLFECVDHNPSEKKLGVFARAGANEKSGRFWMVVRDVPDKCRGVAGLIWCSESLQVLESTVEWDDVNHQRKLQYATDLGMTLEEAESLTTKSVGFIGTIVVVGGVQWGVLLIDTLVRGYLIPTPTTQTEKAKAKRHHEAVERCAELLGHIIRESSE